MNGNIVYAVCVGALQQDIEYAKYKLLKLSTSEKERKIFKIVEIYYFCE